MKNSNLDTATATAPEMTGVMNPLKPQKLFAKGRINMLMGMILAAVLLTAPTMLRAAGPAPVYLGEAAHFTILAGAAITTTGGGIIDGDIGAYPIDGSAIGIPPVQVNGTIYARDATGTQATNVVIDANLLLSAKNDMHTAWVDAAGRTPVPEGDHLNPQGGNLGGLDLAPGLYKITATAYITGSDLILRGAPDDVWIFMCAQDLQVGSGIKVILAGSARAKNIFWQVGTSAVLGTGSVFKGTIIADASVTMQSTSTLEGRALAYTAGVTFDGTGGMLPDHEMNTDLDDDNSNGIAPDFANVFNAGSVLPVAISDDDATVTNSNYQDVISLTISGDGIVDGADEIVSIAGEDYPQNIDKTATVLKGLTTFKIVFTSLTKKFSISKDGGGRMPIADLNNLIRAITYKNTNIAPTAGERTFEFVVNDGVTDSNAAVSTMTVNYAPEIDLDADNSGGILGADFANTFTEGDSAVSMTDPLDATITDNGDIAMLSLTITSIDIVDGANEIVSIGGVPYPQNADKTATVIKGLTTFKIAFVNLTKKFTVIENGGGIMPLADLNDLLRDISYENTSLTPTAGERTFDFVANDGFADSNIAVSTITVNHAPLIDLDADNSSGILGADFTNTFTEGDPAVSMTDSLDATITDNDDIAMFSLSITGRDIINGDAEVVSIGGVPYPQNTDKTATVIIGLTTFQIDFVSLSKVFSITENSDGKMPLANLNDLLRDISYENTSLTPTAGERTFEFVANDGFADSNVAVSTITVIPTYILTVGNGTGSGSYIAGAFVPVIATIPAGKVFDSWAGDIAHLADPLFASTIATVPATDIAITAIFVDAPPDTYTLTVVNGTGGGSYEAGKFAPVVAVIPVGKVFDTWTGDTVHLTDPLSASTIATMPAFPISVIALFVDAPPDTYALTVVNGTGGGSYEAGQFASVVAVIPAGKVFDTWTGDTAHLADPLFASTIATMPAFPITVTALFVDAPPDTYTLTVVNGTGGGSYIAGAFVPVIATIPVGKVFDTWAGDIGHLTDPSAASTIATMPAFPITVTALFVDAPPATYTLTVVNGTGGGSYIAGAVVPVIATIPAGKVFDTWAGDIGHLADPASASTIATMPALPITVTAKFVDAPPATYTLTVVNGTGGGSYIAGAFVPVIATIPVGKVFDTWAGDIGHLTDPSAASTIATMPAFPITVSARFVDAPPATYTLTVVNGTGGGSYEAGAFVPVIATIPPGKLFDIWAGDIGHLTDPSSASTIATMPAFPITISALFVDAPPDTYTLTVVNGTGGGSYAAGVIAPIIATIPAGKIFDTWVGAVIHLAAPAAASTNATMPAFAITVSARFVDAPPDTYTLTVVNGTGGGSYTVGTIVPVSAVVPLGRTFASWAGNIGHLVDPASANTSVTMPALAITVAAVFNAEPPWYPRIPWTPVADFEWYNFQIWDGVPEAAGTSILLETNVMRSEMTPAREYLLITSDGMLPGNYFWRYRTWFPNSDTYGDTWLPAAGARILTVDYCNSPINDTQYPVDPSGLSCTPNPGVSGNFNLEFLAANAQGYDLEVTGSLPQNKQILHNAYFMPGADKVVPFNVATTRTVTLVGPDTCTWRVRGFNPFGYSEWSSGPDITVTAAAAIPTAGVPDYNFMRPTDDWWVVTEPGGTAPLAFAWNSVPGAAGYMIYVASADGVPIYNYVDIGNVTRVDSIGGRPLSLPAGTYLWSLVAYNAANPRQYGGWNHSPRTPTQESPIFFQVIENLTAPTINSATKDPAANTVAITWVGIAPRTVDVLLFYPGSGRWLEFPNQLVTVTGALTGTIPLGRTWGASTNYILLTGHTATGLTGPRSRMFVLP